MGAKERRNALTFVSRMKYLAFTLLFLGFWGFCGAQEPVFPLEFQKTSSDTVYPFHILLRSPKDSSATFSNQVLPQNGKPTLIAFWLTTCYPCRMELETYTKKYAEWQAQTPFNLLAISTDFPQNYAKIDKAAALMQLPFPVYWDANRQFRDRLNGELNGLPQVFLFDKNGKLVWRHKRFLPGDENETFAKIQSLK